MYNCYNGTIVIIEKAYREYFVKVLLIILNIITVLKKGVTLSPKQQLYNCNNGTIVILKKLLIVYSKIVLLIMWNSNTHSKKGNTLSLK